MTPEITAGAISAIGTAVVSLVGFSLRLRTERTKMETKLHASIDQRYGFLIARLSRRLEQVETHHDECEQRCEKLEESLRKLRLGERDHA